MKQDPKRTMLSSPRPIHAVAPPIGQGKIILAIVLIVVMAFLWMRVFFRHRTPAVASAQNPTPQAKVNPLAAESSRSVAQLTYVGLPVVPGRHDTLARDVFACPKAAVFPWQTPIQANPVQPVETSGDPLKDQWEKQVRPLIERMTVDAIVTDSEGIKSQAYIQEKCLSVGDILRIKQGTLQYELTVKEIRSNAVVLGWKTYSETLKMSEPDNSGEI